MIRHVAEPILLLAHEDRDTLLAANVHIDYRPSTPNYDPESVAVRSSRSIAIDKGDVDRRASPRPT